MRHRLRPALFLLLALAAGMAAAAPPSRTTAATETGEPPWAAGLERRLQAIDASLGTAGIGVYVLHMERNASYGYRATEPWYLASGVKVPVAIAVLREVESGALSRDTRVVLRPGAFVGGPRATHRPRPGGAPVVSWLLEQMIVHSDNTASDVLSRTVGLHAVNQVAAELGGPGRHMTTLGDVRR